MSWSETRMSRKGAKEKKQVCSEKNAMFESACGYAVNAIDRRVRGDFVLVGKRRISGNNQKSVIYAKLYNGEGFESDSTRMVSFFLFSGRYEKPVTVKLFFLFRFLES
jgi:hypothetical protein